MNAHKNENSLKPYKAKKKTNPIRLKEKFKNVIIFIANY